MLGQRFKDDRDNVWILVERKTNSSNYCLCSHHLVPMHTCYGNTIEEVVKLAKEKGYKKYYGDPIYSMRW